MNRMRLWLTWVLLLAGCSSAEGGGPLPTAPLIPPTQTPIPPPATATATPQVLTDPLDLIRTATPTAVTADAPNDLREADPIASELVAIAQRVIADQLGVPIRRVRLAALQPVIWEDAALGCYDDDADIIPQETPGYRIVLAVGNDEYIFHTDFDRVLPCAVENERLPASVSGEATTEATAQPEATDDL
jgi:hypothetical protein